MRRGLRTALVAIALAWAMPAAAQADEIWLRIRFAGTDATERAVAAELNSGGRPGPVVHPRFRRAYPLPGYVPSSDAGVQFGHRLMDPLHDRPLNMTIRRTADGAYRLLDGEDRELALLAAQVERPVVQLVLPVGPFRDLLPPRESGIPGVDALRHRILDANEQVRVASIAAPRVRKELPPAKWRVDPSRRRLVPDRAPSGRASSINLGANLADRWQFVSVPPGAVLTFPGISEGVATDVAIRNLAVAAARSFVMRKAGYGECRHQDATLEVVQRGGLEWNRIRCRLRPLTDEGSGGGIGPRG